MRLLHTSDWHLGITLNDESRAEEMRSFFRFLLSLINEKNIDTLIIAGDIYDSVSPSNEAERLYYSFLSSLSNTCCKDVIVIAGNHDSPSKLDTTKEILESLNVHVYTSALNLEPLVLDERAVILPVPFPRDQELRKCNIEESKEVSDDKYRLAIKNLYRELYEKAKCYELPIIAAGHLFVSNAVSDDKKPDLYVGGLGVVDPSIFPDDIAYTALGHIHKPQALNSKGTIRYSGSPIAMSFAETGYSKSVVIADIEKDRDTEIELIEVPVFRKLFRVKGSREELLASLKELKEKNEAGWVSLEMTEYSYSGTLKEDIAAITDKSGLKVISIKDLSIRDEIERSEESIRPLSVMSEEDVFKALMREKQIADDKQNELLELYAIALKSIKEDEDEDSIC